MSAMCYDSLCAICQQTWPVIDVYDYERRLYDYKRNKLRCDVCDVYDYEKNKLWCRCTLPLPHDLMTGSCACAPYHLRINCVNLEYNGVASDRF